MKNVQERNQKTALLLAERVASEATAEWLPLLKVWRGQEIKRVRERLGVVIERLERTG